MKDLGLKAHWGCSQVLRDIFDCHSIFTGFVDGTKNINISNLIFEQEIHEYNILQSPGVLSTTCVEQWSITDKMQRCYPFHTRKHFNSTDSTEILKWSRVHAQAKPLTSIDSGVATASLHWCNYGVTLCLGYCSSNLISFIRQCEHECYRAKCEHNDPSILCVFG